MSHGPEWRALGSPLTALLLGLLVLSAAFALGGVFAYACGLLALCAGVLACMAPVPTAPRHVARLLLGLGAFLVLYMALTVVPMPVGMLARIAPAQAAVWERALRPFDQSTTWATLSLDPTATKNEITKLLLYGCVFVVALGLAERRRGTSSLERVICAVTSLVALVSLGHWALGQTLVFGVYQPELARTPRHMSVFLNANHLAEVMAIGGAVATGVLVSARERARQIEGALALALATLCSAVAASRGGLVALVLGAAVALVGGRGRLDARRARLVTLGALIVGAVMVVVVAGSEEVMTEAFSRDTEKTAVFRQSLPLLFRYGLFGIGRGAFESVSSEARRDLGAYVFTHPENLLLQWSIEWGVLVTVVVLVVLVRALAPSVLRGRAIMPWGAYGGLLAFFLQNQVDYGSEVPGVVLLALCCLALVTGGARALGGKKDGDDERIPPRVLATRALGVLACGAGVLTWLGSDHELWVEMRGLTQGLREPEFPKQLRAATERHPAEAHFAYLGALRAATVEHESVLPWVTRVLERSPVHGRAHLLLARELETKAPSQARLEYRLAYAEDYRTHASCLEGARRLARGYDEATELVPRAEEAVATDVAGRRTIEVPLSVRLGAISTVATGIQSTLPASRERLLRAYLGEAVALPTVGAALVEPLALAAVDDVLLRAPWCQGDEATCMTEARAWVTRWLALAPSAVPPRTAAARLLATTDAERAQAFLAASEPEVDDVPTLLLDAAELAERARLPTATALLDRALGRCSGVDECSTILARGIAFELRRGRPERALVFLRRKTELVPHEVSGWREQAALAERLGLFTESQDAWNEVLVLAPGDPTANEALQRLRVTLKKRSLPALPSD